MVWAFVFVLLGACSRAEGTNAGLKGRVTQKGLEYGQQFGLELVKSLLKKEHVPDLNGSYNIPLIGDVGYSVSRMQIQELQLNESVVSFSEGTGVRLVVSNAHIQLSGVWRVKVLFIPDSGSFDLSVRDLSLSIELGVSRDDSGHPQVWSTNCHSSIGRLDVKFHDGASWLYNLFTGALQGPLRYEVNRQLCPELRKGISDLERVLKTMQVSAQIDPFAAIDYSLINKPVIARDHGDIDLKGEFYGVGKHTESPFSPAPFLLPDEGDHMLLLGLSEFSANSAAFVYFTAGALRKNFRDDMIPKLSPIRLNTGSMGLFFPELKKLYPDMPMELHLSARKQPLLTCRPDSLALALFGAAEAFVVLPNTTLASAFLLDLDASLVGQLHLDSAKVGGSVALTNFSMSMVQSHIGSVQVKTLETLLKLALRMVALPMVNKKLKEGFPLTSVYNVSLVNPLVKINQGFVLVATDVQYKA
ncbi:bactericidal permeability-increasing protein-like [Dermochelys coriacea]|uniref:bactericidal permeability-increasing protein-like n=1 Tax=Dermochelys coriacea TaxID=27794 RepID=UPI0018E6E420|nr:bactericidal permeability-increasing protein-like [Dermochelys coriacea]